MNRATCSTTAAPAAQQLRPGRIAAGIAALYLLFSTIWILVSDRLLLQLASDSHRLSQLQTFKGMLFVVLSALLVFVLAQRSLSGIRRTQEVLRHNEQRLQDILNATGASSWEWNLQTGALAINEHSAAMIGYSLAELEPLSITTWRRLAHPEDLQRSESLIARHLAGELPAYRCEARLRHKQGYWIWVLDCGRVVQWHDGQPLLMAGTHQDISALKQLQEDLQHKNREMEQLIYSVSHDLKSPLVTIKAFLALLRQDLTAGDDARITKDLNYLDGAASRMEQLLAGLLQLSRVGRLEQPAQTRTVNSLVQDSLAALAGRLQDHSIQLQIADMPQLLRADPLQLVQLWQNLIENAIKYRGQQAQLRIDIGVRSSSPPVFYVCDNGLGIEPQQCERIFGLFTQLDPNAEGSGLGLALAKKIVSHQGGQIWAESAGLGLGSCFCFTLPAALQAATMPPESPAP